MSEQQYLNSICGNCGHSNYQLIHKPSNHGVFQQETEKGIKTWLKCCNNCCEKHVKDEVFYKYDIAGHQDLINKNIELKKELKFMREIIDLKKRIILLENELGNKILMNKEYLKKIDDDIQKALFDELKNEFCDVDSFDKFVAERRKKN